LTPLDRTWMNIPLYNFPFLIQFFYKTMILLLYSVKRKVCLVQEMNHMKSHWRTLSTNNYLYSMYISVPRWACELNIITEDKKNYRNRIFYNSVSISSLKFYMYIKLVGHFWLYIYRTQYYLLLKQTPSVAAKL